ncbi:MAG TPA: cytochrome c [Candidatus Krumholzibacteria bacterium]|nr:cytochrome c [Candidatus Krumholzibacteria bacterium]
MHRRYLMIVAALAVSTAACEKHRNNSSWSTEAPVVETALVPGATPSRGVGPITYFDVNTIPASRATEGEQLFKTRCSACHKIEERYIGPALSGVTKRRQPEWILNMILKPELMLAQDPVAMELLAKFLTPMANQNMTQHEAESVYAYFREHDKSLPDLPADGSADTAAPEEETPKGPPGTN